jgi:hypothetical protein
VLIDEEDMMLDGGIILDDEGAFDDGGAGFDDGADFDDEGAILDEEGAILDEDVLLDDEDELLVDKDVLDIVLEDSLELSCSEESSSPPPLPLSRRCKTPSCRLTISPCSIWIALRRPRSKSTFGRCPRLNGADVTNRQGWSKRHDIARCRIVAALERDFELTLFLKSRSDCGIATIDDQSFESFRR